MSAWKDPLYKYYCPPPPLASIEAFQTHLLGLAVHSSAVWRRAKAEPAPIETVWVGYYGWVWESSDKFKKGKEKKIKVDSTNEDCHSSSHNIMNMNKMHTKEKHLRYN